MLTPFKAIKSIAIGNLIVLAGIFTSDLLSNMYNNSEIIRVLIIAIFALTAGFLAANSIKMYEVIFGGLSSFLILMVTVSNIQKYMKSEHWIYEVAYLIVVISFSFLGGVLRKRTYPRRDLAV
jgi:hypothetical protein